MRKVLISIVVLLCGGLLACQSDEAKLADHLERGADYVESEDWSEAIIEYKNVLQIDPNHAGAHFQLSQAYLQTNKPREAFWELRETVRLDPSNHDAKLQFAQISLYAGEIEEALKRAQEVMEADASRVESYVVAAQAYESLKQLDEAEAAYAKAVEVDPESHKPLILYATFLRRQGNREAAEPLYRKATEISPELQTFLALGGFLAEERRDDEAEAVYRKALEHAEGDVAAGRAYSIMAGYLHQRERYDESVAVLEEGITKSENPLDLIYLLASMYRQRGMEDEADAMALRATEARPDDPAPFLVLSAYRGQTGDMEGALEAAEKAAALSSEEDFSGKLRVAEVLLEIGFRNDDPEQIERGRQIVNEVLAVDSSSPPAIFVKAKLDIAERRLEEGITGLRSAIDLRPDWAKAHFLLGTALALTGERTAARTELARALEIDTTLIEARRVLADVHAALGEHEYAVEEGRRYLAQYPDNAKTHIRVAQSLMLLGRSEEAMAEVAAIEEAKRDADVNYAIGRIHMVWNDLPQSRTYLELALEEKPYQAEILTSLLQIDEREGKLDESEARVEKALASKPEDARLHQLKARLALVRGDVAEAEAALKQAIELQPEAIASYRQLAQLYARTGRTGETIKTYERALEVKPEQPQIHHFLAVLYEYGGQKERAIEHYETAIRYEPNLGEAKNNLAYIYAESGDKLDRALDLAQEAKALMPDNPNTADTLGWVLFRRGVPTAAIGYLKEAVAGMDEGDPNLGLVRHHLAQAYEASGDTEMARKTLDQALSDHESYLQEKRVEGVTEAPEPVWIAEAQEMRKRL